MNDPIICPLWEPNDKQFRSRHYHAWDRCCDFCGRTVVVSDAVKQQLDSSAKTLLICDHCALIRAPESEIEALHEPSSAIEDGEACATCAALREQEESAAKELARCEGLPDGSAAKNA
jgi:hypothetical protein